MFGSKKKKPDRDEYVQPLLFEPERFPAHLPPPENPQLFVHGDFPGVQLFRDPEFPGKTFIFEGEKMEKKVKKVKKPERDEHQPLLFEPERFLAHLLPPENPLVFVHGDFPGVRLFRHPDLPGKTFIFEEKKKEKEEPEHDEQLELLLIDPEDYPDIPPPNKIKLFVHEDFPRAVLFRSPEFPGKTFYYAKRAYVETRTPWYGENAHKAKTTLPEALETETTLPEALHVTEFQVSSPPESQGDCDGDSDIVACKAVLHASTKFVKASAGEAHTTDFLTDPTSTSPTKVDCDEDTGPASRQSINAKTKDVKDTVERFHVTETRNTSAQVPELVVDDSEETNSGETDHASSKGPFRKVFESFYLGKPDIVSPHGPMEVIEGCPRVDRADEAANSSETRVKETAENFYLTDFSTTSSRRPEPIVADSENATSVEVARASNKERFRELVENFYLGDSNTDSPHKPIAVSEEDLHVETTEVAKNVSESCVKETVENFYLTDFRSESSQTPEVTRGEHHEPASEGPAEGVAELRSNETVKDFYLPEFWTPEFWIRIPSEPEPSADAQRDQPIEGNTEYEIVLEEELVNNTEDASSGAAVANRENTGDHSPGQSIKEVTEEATGVHEGPTNVAENGSTGATFEEPIDEGDYQPNHFIEEAAEEVTTVEEGSDVGTGSANRGATTATKEVTGIEERSAVDTENVDNETAAGETIDQEDHHHDQIIEGATEEVMHVEEGSNDGPENDSSNATAAETINEGQHTEVDDAKTHDTNDRGTISGNQTADTAVPTEDGMPQGDKVPGRRSVKTFLESILGIDEGPIKLQKAPAQDPPSQDQHAAQEYMSPQTDASAPATSFGIEPETCEVIVETVPPQQKPDDNDDLAGQWEIYFELEARRDEQVRRSEEEFAARVKRHGLEYIAGLSVKDSKITNPEPIVTDPKPIVADSEPVTVDPEPFIADSEPFVADPEPIVADPMAGLDFEAMPDETVIGAWSSTNEPIRPSSCAPCIRDDPWAPRMPNRIFGHDIPDCETFCQGLIGVIMVFYFFRPDKLPAFIRYTFGRFVSPYNRRMWNWLRLLTGILIFIRIAYFGLPDGLFEIVCDYPDESEDHWPQIWYVPEHAIPIFKPYNGDYTPERRW